MATANSVIKQALGLLGVLQLGESPTAAEADDALSLFNNMLTAWELQGITLNHISVTLTDTLPYPADHNKAFAYNLALELAPCYGRDVSQMVYDQALSEYDELLSLYGKQDSALNTNGYSY